MLTRRLIVVIGLGAWRALAAETARRLTASTGWESTVLDRRPDGMPEGWHPSWAKLWLFDHYPDAEVIMAADADLLPVQKWTPPDVSGLAVALDEESSAVRHEALAYGLDPARYFNGGLWIAHRRAVPVLELARSMGPRYGKWLEQTALNRAVQALGVEVQWLPRSVNRLVQPGGDAERAKREGAINLHLCGRGGNVAAVSEEMDALSPPPMRGRTRLDWLATLPKGSHGAELGVFRGEFSREILAIVQPRHLHLVDLFAGAVTSGDADGKDVAVEDMTTMRERLPRDKAVIVHKVDSIAFLDSCALLENRLDWVYIDTAHTYEQTVGELRSARRAVKPGGIIAGHDYSPAFPGVMRAVDEFVAEHGLELDVWDGDALPTFSIVNRR